MVHSIHQLQDLLSEEDNVEPVSMDSWPVFCDCCFKMRYANQWVLMCDWVGVRVPVCGCVAGYVCKWMSPSFIFTPPHAYQCHMSYQFCCSVHCAHHQHYIVFLHTFSTQCTQAAIAAWAGANYLKEMGWHFLLEKGKTLVQLSCSN